MDSLEQKDDTLKKVSQSLHELGKQVTKSMMPIIEATNQLKLALKPFEIFVKERKIQNLTRDGWYLSVEFLDTYGTIGDSIEIGNNWSNDKVKQLFYSRVKEIIDEYAQLIKEKMEVSWPERAAISKELFSQFSNDNYYSFIPLCLSQINGISKDKTGIDFFSTDYSTNTQKIGNEAATDSLFSLIKAQIQIGDRNDLELLKKDYIGEGLNRHAIMHGESLKYGTEENAFKALLLLDFVIELCEDWKEK